MNLKEKIIKFLGGYTQLEFDLKAQDIKKDLEKDYAQKSEDIQNTNQYIQGYLEGLSRDNLIAIDRINLLLILLKTEIDNKASLKNKDLILDTYLEIRHLILRSNKTIIDLCKNRNIDIAETCYISQLVVESELNPFRILRFISPKKNDQYKIKILRQNIEVIATVETDIYFEKELGFCFRYTVLNERKFISPNDVEIISRYYKLGESQLI